MNVRELNIYYIAIALFLFIAYLLFVLYTKNKTKQIIQDEKKSKINYLDLTKIKEIEIENNKEPLLLALKKLNKEGDMQTRIKYALLSYDFSTSFIEELLKEKIDDTLPIEEIVKIIKDRIKDRIKISKREGINIKNQGGILLIGVNGGGKTLSAVKLGTLLKKKGKKLILAPADTYRAAAIEQLTTLCNKNNLEVITSKRGEDPASVTYRAMELIENKNYNYAIIDTSGRLDNNINLINQLKKIKNIVEKKFQLAETICIYDCRMGLSGIEQIKNFNSAIKIDSIILTKLDAILRPGVVLELICNTSLPIIFAANGENIDAFSQFNLDKFLSDF